MKYTRFEELPVWQDAMALSERTFSMTDDRAFGRKGDLGSQRERAAQGARRPAQGLREKPFRWGLRPMTGGLSTFCNKAAAGSLKRERVRARREGPSSERRVGKEHP
jgi:hypothetical protein